MTGCKLIFTQPLLYFYWQAQQSQHVGYGGTVLSNAARHFFLRHSKLCNEPFVGLRFLHGIQIFALKVLNKCQLKRRILAGLTDHGRNPVESGPLRSPPPTLSSDKLEKTVLQRPDDDRLHNPVLFY